LVAIRRVVFVGARMLIIREPIKRAEGTMEDKRLCPDGRVDFGVGPEEDRLGRFSRTFWSQDPASRESVSGSETTRTALEIGDV
jgi:hypothetical protein